MRRGFGVGRSSIEQVDPVAQLPCLVPGRVDGSVRGATDRHGEVVGRLLPHASLVALVDVVSLYLARADMAGLVGDETISAADPLQMPRIFPAFIVAVAVLPSRAGINAHGGASHPLLGGAGETQRLWRSARDGDG